MRHWTSKTRSRAISHGYRSGLEEQVAKYLETAGVPVVFEEHKIDYVIPARPAKYTPDFRLPDGSYIETKGRFLVADRHKHLLIKDQRPDIKIRFLFQNANARISKTSKTTYASWCDKHGFEYAHKHVPDNWIRSE